MRVVVSPVSPTQTDYMDVEEVLSYRGKGSQEELANGREGEKKWRDSTCSDNECGREVFISHKSKAKWKERWRRGVRWREMRVSASEVEWYRCIDLWKWRRRDIWKDPWSGCKMKGQPHWSVKWKDRHTNLGRKAKKATFYKYNITLDQCTWSHGRYTHCLRSRVCCGTKSLSALWMFGATMDWDRRIYLSTTWLCWSDVSCGM